MHRRGQHVRAERRRDNARVEFFNHQSSRHASMPNHIWADRAPKRTGGQYPTQHPRSLYGPRRRATMCVTPRQTCPRHNGFGRNLRSKTRWFTGFCNSHQVSHFAAFFIDARAKISVAESRFKFDTRPIPGCTPRTGHQGAGSVLSVP